MNPDREAQRVQVSVVVPAFNEERRIRENVQRLLIRLGSLGLTAELVVVNDGSTDRTGEMLGALKAEAPQLTVVSYSRNRGRGYAMRQGFAAASGDVVVTTEADLTYGEDIIGRLVDRLRDSGADLVVASPYMQGGQVKGVPFRRAFISAAGNWLLSLAIPGRLRTITGMTRAYRRPVLESMDLTSDGKEIHLEILSKAIALGFQVEEMPATLSWECAPERANRQRGFLPGRLIFSHLMFCFDERPFLLFGTIGLLILLTGAGFGAYALCLSLGGEPVGGRPIVLGATLLVLFGLQLIMFSFLSNQSRDLKRQLVNMERRLLLEERCRSTRSA